MGSTSIIRRKHVVHSAYPEQTQSFPLVQDEQSDPHAYGCAGLEHHLQPEAAGSFAESKFRSCEEHKLDTIQMPPTPSTVAPESDDDRCQDLMVSDVEKEECKAQARSNVEKVEMIAGWPDLPGSVTLGPEESAEEDGQEVDRKAGDARPSLKLHIHSTAQNSPRCSGHGASPKSLTCSSYIERWAEPHETLILLDFDDTLCPSSYMLEHPGCCAGIDPRLPMHEAAVTHLLEVASSLGYVQIVTMAGDAWVDHCISLLMPGLRKKLTELNIGVCGAHSNVPAMLMREAHAEGREPSQFLKTRVMKRIIRKFYNRGERRQHSWKNILSIGDSEAERLALQDTVFHHIQKDRHGVWKDCRCKTLLLLANPTVEELTTELKLVAQLLPALVHHDGDLDMDLDEDELDASLQLVE